MAIIGITSGACRGAAAQTVPAAQRGSAVSPDPAARLDAATLEKVDSFIAKHRARFGWPGVAVSVGTPDSVVFARGYGTATLGGDPITERTPFHIGSVTKTFTALAAARLAEAGRLDLDAPVEEYLPRFTMQPPFVPRSIVVRHLLHHRSGVAQWDGHDRRAQTDGRFDPIAPRRAPGGEAEYSSLNYVILGRIVESVSGRPYAEHVAAAILEPLGMEDAFVAGAGVRLPTLVAYFPDLGIPLVASAGAGLVGGVLRAPSSDRPGRRVALFRETGASLRARPPRRHLRSARTISPATE
jgi:CubicO group peptidase (beta-lactamase class C family)